MINHQAHTTPPTTPIAPPTRQPLRKLRPLAARGKKCGDGLAAAPKTRPTFGFGQMRCPCVESVTPLCRLGRKGGREWWEEDGGPRRPTRNKTKRSTTFVRHDDGTTTLSVSLSRFPPSPFSSAFSCSPAPPPSFAFHHHSSVDASAICLLRARATPDPTPASSASMASAAHSRPHATTSAAADPLKQVSGEDEYRRPPMRAPAPERLKKGGGGGGRKGQKLKLRG